MFWWVYENSFYIQFNISLFILKYLHKLRGYSFSFVRECAEGTTFADLVYLRTHIIWNQCLCINWNIVFMWQSVWRTFCIESVKRVWHKRGGTCVRTDVTVNSDPVVLGEEEKGYKRKKHRIWFRIEFSISSWFRFFVFYTFWIMSTPARRRLMRDFKRYRSLLFCLCVASSVSRWSYRQLA